jgi:glycosyltransferase involved in cell wall biosynthesis
VPDLALAFVGCVVPDAAEYRTTAFSRAANLWQSRLLESLCEAGLAPSRIISYRPVSRRSGRAWYSARRVAIAPGLQADLLPLLNRSPLKPLWLGLAALCALLGWGWFQARGRRRIILSYNVSVPPAPFLWLAARLTGSVLVSSLNDVMVPGETGPDNWARRLDFRMHRFWLPAWDGFIAVTPATVADLAPAAPFVVVEGGVAELPPEPAPRSGSPFTLVLAGKLAEHNGLRLALAAFARLEGDRWRLEIAGDGPLQEEARRAAVLDPRIRSHGVLDWSAVQALYARADLVLNLRLTQSAARRYFFPSKLMEALGCGVPVLSTPCNHVRAAFGHCLFLLEEESPEGLAVRLQELAALSPAQRRAVAQRAREVVRTRLAWPVQGARIRRFLSDLAWRGPARSLEQPGQRS